MKRCLLLLALAPVFLTTASAAEITRLDATPAQKIAALKQKLRASRLANADLRDERDAQNAVIEDLQAENTRLKARIAAQPDPLDAILARDADGQWAAMTAIWRAFPALPAGLLCGYDKASVTGDGVGLTLTSYTFYRWSGC